jgi:predicted HTH domain antitoxin
VTHLHVELNIPDTVSDALRATLQVEAREQTVLALFRRGVCSAGLAAQLLGQSYAEFLEFLKMHGVAYAPAAPDDLEADRATLAFLDSRPPADPAR